MATRYDPCPTCTTQIATNFCDNCLNHIPQDVPPAVTGRVWHPGRQGFVSVDLCATCTGQDVNLLAVVTAPTDEDPGEGDPGEGEPGGSEGEQPPSEEPAPETPTEQPVNSSESPAEPTQ
ncbi:hypothetical protein DMH12_15435 [Streptomyces sp. WAC 04229]|uniref:hypothetical protein n=1 Tax=Streptomyces sp. WAC 04229 TaxID=2203206 RepID=UPI000F73D329|nr:hypothetical protein [Streptomyces sp. WAC 04229]RSN55608.1 hypothetical protein DMH12_15435 [Streptomyces sp. WAC 04229]